MPIPLRPEILNALSFCPILAFQTMARRFAPDHGTNSLLSRQESAISALAEACDARKVSGRRDRLLLMLVAATGLPIGFAVQIRQWQLTYFFEPSPDDRERYPDRLDRVGERPWPYSRIGLYWDYRFDRLLPIPRSIYKMLRGYAAETGAIVVLTLHDLNQVMCTCTTSIAVVEGQVVAIDPKI